MIARWTVAGFVLTVPPGVSYSGDPVMMVRGLVTQRNKLQELLRAAYAERDTARAAGLELGAMVTSLGSANDQIRTARDAALAEVERLRGVMLRAVEDLREHVPDGCAGPSGNAREGACGECRLAAWLERETTQTAPGRREGEPGGEEG